MHVLQTSQNSSLNRDGAGFACVVLQASRRLVAACASAYSTDLCYHNDPR